jgi:hypothetical protein
MPLGGGGFDGGGRGGDSTVEEAVVTVPSALYQLAEVRAVLAMVAMMAMLLVLELWTCDLPIETKESKELLWRVAAALHNFHHGDGGATVGHRKRESG